MIMMPMFVGVCFDWLSLNHSVLIICEEGIVFAKCPDFVYCCLSVFLLPKVFCVMLVRPCGYNLVTRLCGYNLVTRTEDGVGQANRSEAVSATQTQGHPAATHRRDQRFGACCCLAEVSPFWLNILSLSPLNQSMSLSYRLCGLSGTQKKQGKGRRMGHLSRVYTFYKSLNMYSI